MQGIVERQDKRYIYVNLGKIEAVLSKQDQMPNEFYQPHDRIKVYVSRVENTSKGPQVFVSRSHPDLLRRLFEQEVPEVYDGIVEIVSIAREVRSIKISCPFKRSEHRRSRYMCWTKRTTCPSNRQ